MGITKENHGQQSFVNNEDIEAPVGTPKNQDFVGHAFLDHFGTTRNCVAVEPPQHFKEEEMLSPNSSTESKGTKSAPSLSPETQKVLAQNETVDQQPIISPISSDAHVDSPDQGSIFPSSAMVHSDCPSDSALGAEEMEVLEQHCNTKTLQTPCDNGQCENNCSPPSALHLHSSSSLAVNVSIPALLNPSTVATALTPAAQQPATVPQAVRHDPKIKETARSAVKASKKAGSRRKRAKGLRNMSKRKIAKAAAEAASARGLQLAHMARTEQISDEELLRLNPKKPRRTPRFSNASSSQFCHICSRKKEIVRLAPCSKIKDGLCRKVVCDECFQTHGYGKFEDALDVIVSDWLCTHCRGVCPPEAQCFTYQRINDRLRVSRLKHKCPPRRSSKSSRGSHSCEVCSATACERDGAGNVSEQDVTRGADSQVQSTGTVTAEGSEHKNDSLPTSSHHTESTCAISEMHADLVENHMQLLPELGDTENEVLPNALPSLVDLIPSAMAGCGAEHNFHYADNMEILNTVDATENDGQGFPSFYNYNDAFAFNNTVVIEPQIVEPEQNEEESVPDSVDQLRELSLNGMDELAREASELYHDHIEVDMMEGFDNLGDVIDSLPNDAMWSLCDARDVHVLRNIDGSDRADEVGMHANFGPFNANTILVISHTLDEDDFLPRDPVFDDDIHEESDDWEFYADADWSMN